MVNKERIAEYLNSLEKVNVNDQFLIWDPERQSKAWIVSVHTAPRSCTVSSWTWMLFGITGTRMRVEL